MDKNREFITNVPMKNHMQHQQDLVNKKLKGCQIYGTSFTNIIKRRMVCKKKDVLYQVCDLAAPEFLFRVDKISDALCETSYMPKLIAKEDSPMGEFVTVILEYPINKAKTSFIENPSTDLYFKTIKDITNIVNPLISKDMKLKYYNEFKARLMEKLYNDKLVSTTLRRLVIDCFMKKFAFNDVSSVFVYKKEELVVIDNKLVFLDPTMIRLGFKRMEYANNQVKNIYRADENKLKYMTVLSEYLDYNRLFMYDNSILNPINFF